jgi:hypothetical protein
METLTSNSLLDRSSCASAQITIHVDLRDGLACSLSSSPTTRQLRAALGCGGLPVLFGGLNHTMVELVPSSQNHVLGSVLLLAIVLLILCCFPANA